MSKKNMAASAAQPQPQVQVPQTDPNQQVDTNAYVPTYKIKPELKDAILKALGDLPFNQIAGIINAVNVEIMDHNTLTKVINVLGQFPYTRVEGLINNINNYIEQILDDEDE
jgi:hypothetical protein